MEDRGTALVAWEKVCLDKKAGGLGVLEIVLQNKALMTKHLHNFFNHHDHPGFN